MVWKAANPKTASRPSLNGQASIEVLVYVGFFLLIFVVLNLFFVVQMGQDISSRQYTLSQQTAGQLSDDIRLALLAGPGFNATFVMPPLIGSQPYIARFYKTSMYVESDAPSLAGINGGSSYGNRFYFPIGTQVVLSPNKLLCSGNAPNCPANYSIYFNGQYTKCDPALFLNCSLIYNFTAANGRIRIQNVADAKGNAQLQIISVK